MGCKWYCKGPRVSASSNSIIALHGSTGHWIRIIHLPWPTKLGLEAPIWWNPFGAWFLPIIAPFPQHLHLSVPILETWSWIREACILKSEDGGLDWSKCSLSFTGIVVGGKAVLECRPVGQRRFPLLFLFYHHLEIISRSIKPTVERLSYIFYDSSIIRDPQLLAGSMQIASKFRPELKAQAYKEVMGSSGLPFFLCAYRQSLSPV